MNRSDHDGFDRSAVNADVARKRRDSAPTSGRPSKTLSKLVVANGALPAKMKPAIAVATRGIVRGWLAEELMEAIWVAAVRVGGACAHSTLMRETPAE
jgi:hypothetical protein